MLKRSECTYVLSIDRQQVYNNLLYNCRPGAVMKLAYIANINCPLIVLRCFQPASHLDRDCGGTVEATG